MAQFGSYESSREVYRGGLAVVFTARGPGATDERFAVKMLELPDYLADEERIALESELFLESAETQKRAASSGFWAPVHATGKAQNGAWYVTDLFERSAEKLVLHRRELEPAEIFRVIDGVVQGLVALRRADNRPHGNLKSTNILVSGRGDVSGSRIALCDPIPTSRVRNEEDSTKDLRDLGDLLHQLVLHRPMRSAMSWPLQLSPEWQKLGRVGPGWLELCNALLNPTGAPPSLDEVASFIPELAVKAGPGSSPAPGSGAPTGSGAPPAPRPSSRPGDSRPDMAKSRPPSGDPIGATIPEESGTKSAPPAPASGSSPMLSSGTGSSAPLGSGSHPGSGAGAAPRPSLSEKFRQAAETPKPTAPRKLGWPLYGAVAAVIVVGVLAAVWIINRVGPDPRLALWPEVDAAVKDAHEVRELVEATAPSEDLGGINAALGALSQERQSLEAKEWSRGARADIEAGMTRVRSGVTALQGAAKVLRTKAHDPRDEAFHKLIQEALTRATNTAELVKKTSTNVDVSALDKAAAALTQDAKALDDRKLTRDSVEQIIAEVAHVKGRVKELDGVTRAIASKSDDPRLASLDRKVKAVEAARSLKTAVPPGGEFSGALDDLIGRVEAAAKDADPTAPAWVKGEENPRARQYAAKLDEAIKALEGRCEEVWTKVPDPRKDETLLAKADEAIASADEVVAALAGVPGAKATDLSTQVAAYRKKRDDKDLSAREWTLVNKVEIEEWAKAVREGAPALKGAAEKAWSQTPDPRVQPLKDARALLGALGQDESTAREIAKDDADAKGLLADADALKAARERLSAVIAASGEVPWLPGSREKIASVLKDLAEASGGVTQAQKKLAGAIGANSDRVEKLKQARCDALKREGAAILALIEAGLGAADVGTDSQETLSARVSALRKRDDDYQAVKSDAAIVQAEARVKHLEAIAAMTDGAALFKELLDATSKGQLAEGWAAFTRLGAPERKWAPSGGQQLGTLAVSVQNLRDAAGRLGDKQRSGAMARTLAEMGRAMWRAYMAGVDFKSGTDLRAAREALAPLGLSEAEYEALPARERYNLLLVDLKNGLSGADDDKAGAAVRAFGSGIGSLDEAMRGRDEVKQALAALDGAINAPPPKEEPVDLTRLGPGAKGWTGAESKGPGGVDVVTFTRSGVSLAFARAADTSMVSTSEISVAAFITAVNDAKRWPDVLKLLPRKGEKPFRGPRVWYWTQDADRIDTIAESLRKGYSRGWLLESPDRVTTAYPNAMLDTIKAPDGGYPMQYVSAPAAIYVAALLGSRLPTAEEWAQALATEERVASAPKGNLRDATWDEIRKHAVAQSQVAENKGHDPNWPDEDIFRRRADAFPLASKAEPATDQPDGYVWFAPVDEGGGTLFHHLVGNVAEFVYEKGRDTEGAEFDPDAIVKNLGPNTDGSLKVIGASALSPAQFKPSEALVPDRLDVNNPGARRWSDVGFRLAFTAKSGPPKQKPLADRVRDVADKLAFLAR